MTVGTTVAATGPDRLDAAVNAAARRLYDAEAALHIARQTGVYAWIGAAYARLHEAIADHIAAVDATKVSPGPPCILPAGSRMTTTWPAL